MITYPVTIKIKCDQCGVLHARAWEVPDTYPASANVHAGAAQLARDHLERAGWQFLPLAEAAQRTRDLTRPTSPMDLDRPLYSYCPMCSGYWDDYGPPDPQAAAAAVSRETPPPPPPPAPRLPRRAMPVSWHD